MAIPSISLPTALSLLVLIYSFPIYSRLLFRRDNSFLDIMPSGLLSLGRGRIRPIRTDSRCGFKIPLIG